MENQLTTNPIESITVKTNIVLEIRDKHGKLKSLDTFHNLITSVGKAAMAGLLGNTGAVAAAGWLALGSSNTAPAIGQTALGTEWATVGLSRFAATVTRQTTTVTNDTLQLAGAWTVSGGGGTVEEIGMFNASSVGIMIGRALTGSKALVAGDTLTATYQIIFG